MSSTIFNDAMKGSKKERNQRLSRLPKFEIERSYDIRFINYKSPFFLLIRLIELAKTTRIFTLDTENDIRSGKPAIIQLQFIPNSTSEKTIVTIFEMCHLPVVETWIYNSIQQLFQIIFQQDNTILTWGKGRSELSAFKIYPIFESIPYHLPHHINVQTSFKTWINNNFQPQLYRNLNDQWSLQVAIAYVFGQFLDKSLTLSRWGTGMDRRLYENWKLNALNYNLTSNLTDGEEKYRLKMVQYLVDDCFATTELALLIFDF